MAEAPKTADPAKTTPAVEQAAPEVDLLGDPVVEDQAAPTVEERLAALEAKTESLFDPAELDGRLYEMESRYYAALETKLERIATTAARPAHPRTLDELPGPYAD